MKIGIVDYGMSNLLSITRAVEHIHTGQTEVIKDPTKIAEFDKIILPGVGAFPKGMQALNQLGFATKIQIFAQQNKPILGICLGMQMLLTQGYEIEPTNGLNLIEGTCVKLPDTNTQNQPNVIPHVGWETIQTNNENYAAYNGKFMYFVHSYYAQVHESNMLFTSPFADLQFASAIHKNNIVGFQFHPEKSGEMGLELLKHFITN